MEIKIENLKKYYGRNQILDIKDLTISQGKITAIIGPNGCGKSTLLNIISGLDKEYEGEIRYNKSKISRNIIDNMTIVFQKPYLFKRTVYENIEYPLKLRKVNKKDSKKRVLNIMEELEIEDLMDKKAHLLSGGESQKVALARALVFEPKVLLLDEPTSNIDPDSIQVLEKTILKFNKERKGTILMVTHDMVQSSRVCNSIINIKDGKVS